MPRISALLFQSAKRAAKRAAIESGTLGERNEAMVAVVLCGIVAEAGINEIARWFEFHRSQPEFKMPHGLPYGFERLEVRQKWSLLSMIARQKSFDRASEPWRSFNALVELRNAIVHIGGRPDQLKKKILATGHKELNSRVARWACETVSRMFSELTQLVDPPKHWIDLLWLWTPTHSFPPGLSIPGDADFQRPGRVPHKKKKR